MPIEETIDRLSGDPRVRSLARPTTRVVVLSILAGAVADALSFGMFGGVDLLSRAVDPHDHGFVLNFVFTMSVACCALAMVRDLSIPARPVSLPKPVLAAPFAIMALVGTHELAGFSLHDISREANEIGWVSCFWQIIVLAIPAFALLLVGVRYLAPTDLRRTGAYIGMLSGAIGAMDHCCHVPTEPFAFGALLYTAGIGAMMLAGRLLGPRVLRWT